MQIFPQIENQAIQNAIQRHLNSSNQNINEEKKQTKENEEKEKEKEKEIEIEDNKEDLKQNQMKVEQSKFNGSEKATDKDFEKARANFADYGSRDLDARLMEVLLVSDKENEEKIKEEIKKMTEKELNQVIDESNQEYNENQLIEMAMKESLKEVEIKKKLEEEKALKGINISINPNTINMFKNNLNSMNPSILAVIQAGYSLDQAVMAYSVVGDDPQNMINYILDNFLNNFN